MSKHPTGSTSSEVEGVVTGLRERAEPVGRGERTRIEQVITFRLIGHDEQPQVVMRADRFEGSLFNGDQVTIFVSPRRIAGSTIHTIALTNQTRRSTFAAPPPSNRGYLTRWAFALAIAFCVTVLLVAKVAPGFI